MSLYVVSARYFINLPVDILETRASSGTDGDDACIRSREVNSITRVREILCASFA